METSNASLIVSLPLVERATMTKLRPERTLFNGLLLLVLLLLATPAHADVGVPMLAVVWPASWLLLLLVIPLEAAIPIRSPGITYRQRLKVATSANLVSTLIGIPLTWGVLVFLQMVCGGGAAWGIETPRQKLLAVTLQSPWLIPYEPELHQWMIPAAAAVLCIPFFLMSVWCENRVARTLFDKAERPQVLRWAWQANTASYALILLFLAFKLLAGLHH
jgi:hypothetical protein